MSQLWREAGVYPSGGWDWRGRTPPYEPSGMSEAQSIVSRKVGKGRTVTKNILITGNPGVGKTTLIREIISKLNISAGGFYTSEIRDEESKRWGFKIIALDGTEEIMASVDLISKYKVSRYGVDVSAIDRIGVTAIRDALEHSDMIVIDEIGRMELLSKQFQQAVIDALNSPKTVLGTISAKDTEFTKKIKERQDTRIIKLTKANFPEITTYLERTLRKQSS